MERNINEPNITTSDELMRAILEHLSQHPPGNHSLNPQYVNNVLQRSFEEDKVKVQRCTHEFIESLATKEITNEDFTCSICMDRIGVGEKYISLPCTGAPHHFHEANDSCDGIKKWLELNNSCPICRTQFPGEENKDEETEDAVDVPNDSQDIEMTFSIAHEEGETSNIINMVTQTLQRITETEDERMLQLALYNSLDSTPTVETQSTHTP